MGSSKIPALAVLVYVGTSKALLDAEFARLDIAD